MTSTKEARRLRVANIRANFAHEGGVPDVEHDALLDRYIQGEATLADLFDHAREYLDSAQEQEQRRLDKDKHASKFEQMPDEFEACMEVYKGEQKRKSSERQRMSKEKRERYDAIDAARASVELSGGTVSDETWRESLRYANGEISIDEFLALWRR